jgi:HlyD family secretion protein
LHIKIKNSIVQVVNLLKNMKKKINKKYYYIGAGAFLILLAFLIFRNGKEELNFVTVERGNLTQELFETGSTEKGDDIRLGFKEGGRIESVLSKEGEKVSRGTVIATVDKKDLELSLREAEAALASAQATLQRFLSGSTTEELEVVNSAVRSAEVALLSAENNLKEQEKITDEMLRTTYQNVATLIGNVFSTVKEVEIGVDTLTNTHFTGFVVSETVSGRKSRDIIKRKVKEIEDYKSLTATTTNYKEREDALEGVEGALNTIILEIDNIISVADSDFYKDRISNTEKEILRTYRGLVNSSLSGVISLRGTISSVKVETNAILTAARGGVDSAKSALNQAKAERSRITANPEKTDKAIREAAVTQAKARVDLFKSRIADATLKSPVSGTISNILVSSGEVVAPGSPVAVIVPEKDVQIAVDIYEGDISKVSVGNEAKATFVAFPGEQFEGEVVFVNPTGKVIDGVIYYGIKVVLNQYPERVLPQMTVDVTIRTAEKEDVLLLPERAVRRKDGKNLVLVLENGEKVEKEIVLGLRGEGRMTEIISGLNEGDRVIIE